MGFYYGDAWDGICEWVDGIGWVDPNEDREELYAVTYEWHDSNLIPQGAVVYVTARSCNEAVEKWVKDHPDNDYVWARLATAEEETEWDAWLEALDDYEDDLPFN